MRKNFIAGLESYFVPQLLELILDYAELIPALLTALNAVVLADKEDDALDMVIKQPLFWKKISIENRLTIAVKWPNVADIVCQKFFKELKYDDLTTLAKKHELIAYKLLKKQYLEMNTGGFFTEITAGEEYELLSAIFSHEKCILSFLVQNNREAKYNNYLGKKCKSNGPNCRPLFNCVVPTLELKSIASFTSTAAYYLDADLWSDAKDLKIFCNTNINVAKQLFKHPKMIERLEYYSKRDQWELRTLAIHYKSVAQWLFDNQGICKNLPEKYVASIADCHGLTIPSSGLLSGLFNQLLSKRSVATAEGSSLRF